MNYSEYAPPPELAAMIKVAWTLELTATDTREAEITQLAMPDGCIEIIHRQRGASHWLRAQPARFVVGLIDRPAPLRFSSDSAFSSLRLWPWAWTWLSGKPLALRNNWIDLNEAGLSADDAAVLRTPWSGSWEPLIALFAHRYSTDDLRMARAALSSAETASMATAADVSTRSCQRWFVRHAGLTPRTFRRLRRFEQGLHELETSPELLADQALAAGYSDQSHMAREFRRYAQQPAQRLRGRLRGPFVAS